MQGGIAVDATVFCPIDKTERLLLATDGSVYSEGAIREAISFAKRCSSRLYAISVAEAVADYEGLSPQGIEEAMGSRNRKHLESVKTRAEKEGIQCNIFVAHGVPHQRIVEEASKREIDMIIIGRHKTKGLKKLLIGEVAAKVIGDAPCKVLVVPKEAEIDFRNILVATDGSSHSEAAVLEAIGIAKKCGSKITALSSIRSDDEMEVAKVNVNKVVELGQKEGVPVEALMPKGRSYEVIVETARNRNVDLIVVGAYGKSGVRKFLMGSSTERVIGNADCAVLVVQGQGIKPATV